MGREFKLKSKLVIFNYSGDCDGILILGGKRENIMYKCAPNARFLAVPSPSQSAICILASSPNRKKMHKCIWNKGFCDSFSHTRVHSKYLNFNMNFCSICDNFSCTVLYIHKCFVHTQVLDQLACFIWENVKKIRRRHMRIIYFCTEYFEGKLMISANLHLTIWELCTFVYLCNVFECVEMFSEVWCIYKDFLAWPVVYKSSFRRWGVCVCVWKFVCIVARL